MKIICTKEEQEKLVEILSNTQETHTLSIIEWERQCPEIAHHPNCDNCEDKAKQYSLGFQDGYMIGKERPQGEWITVHYSREELNIPQKASMLDFVKCPFCETIHQGRHNFCSRCGADMRGKEE